MDADRAVEVTAVATATLAVITFFYLLATGVLAWFTRSAAATSANVLKELERQRVEAARPLVIGRLREAVYDEQRDPIGPPVAVGCDLINVGTGPALTSRATLVLTLAPDGTCHELRYLGIGPGFGDAHALAASAGMATLSGSFRLSADAWNLVENRKGWFADGYGYHAELTISHESIYQERFSTVARFTMHMGGPHLLPPLSSALSQVGGFEVGRDARLAPST
jgi:hypothetical protein